MTISAGKNDVAASANGGAEIGTAGVGAPAADPAKGSLNGRAVGRAANKNGHNSVTLGALGVLQEAVQRNLKQIESGDGRHVGVTEDRFSQGFSYYVEHNKGNSRKKPFIAKFNKNKTGSILKNSVDLYFSKHGEGIAEIARQLSCAYLARCFVNQVEILDRSIINSGYSDAVDEVINNLENDEDFSKLRETTKEKHVFEGASGIDFEFNKILESYKTDVNPEQTLQSLRKFLVGCGQALPAIYDVDARYASPPPGGGVLPLKLPTDDHSTGQSKTPERRLGDGSPQFVNETLQHLGDMLKPFQQDFTVSRSGGLVDDKIEERRESVANAIGWIKDRLNAAKGAYGDDRSGSIGLVEEDLKEIETAVAAFFNEGENNRSGRSEMAGQIANRILELAEDSIKGKLISQKSKEAKVKVSPGSGADTPTVADGGVADKLIKNDRIIQKPKEAKVKVSPGSEAATATPADGTVKPIKADGPVDWSGTDKDIVSLVGSQTLNRVKAMLAHFRDTKRSLNERKAAANKALSWLEERLNAAPNAPVGGKFNWKFETAKQPLDEMKSEVSNYNIVLDRHSVQSGSLANRIFYLAEYVLSNFSLPKIEEEIDNFVNGKSEDIKSLIELYDLNPEQVSAASASYLQKFAQVSATSAADACARAALLGYFVTDPQKLDAQTITFLNSVKREINYNYLRQLGQTSSDSLTPTFDFSTLPTADADASPMTQVEEVNQRLQSLQNELPNIVVHKNVLQWDRKNLLGAGALVTRLLATRPAAVVKGTKPMVWQVGAPGHYVTVMVSGKEFQIIDSAPKVGDGDRIRQALISKGLSELAPKGKPNLGIDVEDLSNSCAQVGFAYMQWLDYKLEIGDRDTSAGKFAEEFNKMTTSERRTLHRHLRVKSGAEFWDQMLKLDLQAGTTASVPSSVANNTSVEKEPINLVPVPDQAPVPAPQAVNGDGGSAPVVASGENSEVGEAEQQPERSLAETAADNRRRSSYFPGIGSLMNAFDALRNRFKSLRAWLWAPRIGRSKAKDEAEGNSVVGPQTSIIAPAAAPVEPGNLGGKPSVERQPDETAVDGSPASAPDVFGGQPQVLNSGNADAAAGPANEERTNPVVV